MSNLLYRGYKTGCYVGADSGNLVSYCYGYSSVMASYYADLEPNTTYTIKRYDNSTRFRVGTFTYDAKSLSSDTGTVKREISQWWLKDNSEPLTFTTGNDDIYLVVYYTNASEYNTRVMLNKGTTIEPYEIPDEFIPGVSYWTVDENNYPTKEDFPNMTINSVVTPAPLAYWLKDENNYPTNTLLISPSLLPPYPLAMWYEDEYPKNGFLPEVPEPSNVWYKVEYPTHKLLSIVPDPTNIWYQGENEYPTHKLLSIVDDPIVLVRYRFIYNGRLITKVYANDHLISDVLYPKN